VSRFDRFMVHVDIGTDEKLARLTDAERLCHIAGVLALAAKSPMRGWLLVGDHEAGPVEIARRAGVSEKVARATIDKLASVGILTRDDELGCWQVHNWHRFNPDPKTDNTGAERQARYRARRGHSNGSGDGSNAAGDAPRNGTVTPPEVEGEEEENESPAVVDVVPGDHDARTLPLSIGDDRRALADHVVGVLQRGIDGLTTDEPCKRPTRAAVLAALGDAPRVEVIAAAVDARQVAQSQNRAPNIVALFSQRLSAQLGTEAAA